MACEYDEARSHWQLQRDKQRPENLGTNFEEVEYHVCIIGGGLTGVSAALHCAEAGATCVLLEANELGAGASARNGGVMWPTPDDAFEVGGVHLVFKGLVSESGDVTVGSSFRPADHSALSECLSASGVELSSVDLSASAFIPMVDSVSGVSPCPCPAVRESACRVLACMRHARRRAPRQWARRAVQAAPARDQCVDASPCPCAAEGHDTLHKLRACHHDASASGLAASVCLTCPWRGPQRSLLQFHCRRLRGRRGDACTHAWLRSGA